MHCTKVHNLCGRALLLGGLALLIGSACTRAGPDTDDTDEVPEILGILVSPEKVVIPLGEEVQLTATGLQEDRASLDVTHLATWGSERPAIAQVSDRLDEEGIIRGLSEGETEVWAEVQGIESVPVHVTVTAASLLGLTVLPPEVSVSEGDSVQLKAEAAFSDGTRADASAQVLWVTGDGTVATMAAGGVLNAVGTGSTQIHADWSGTLSQDVPVSVLIQAKPDLRVLAVEGVAGPDDVTLTVTIENSGQVGAADFWVDVFVDPPGSPSIGELGDYYEPVFYLGEDEFEEIAFNFQVDAGNHQIYVVIDTDEEVEESNENNNIFSHNIDVGSSAGGPNLTIDYFEYIADEVSILYAVDVYNSGTEDVGPFYLDLWIDSYYDPTLSGIGDEYTRVDGIDAGKTENADFLITDWCDLCWSWVMVDTNEEIDETDEFDNIAGPLDVESPYPR